MSEATYINFNGLFKIKPDHYYEPKTLQELQDEIKNNKHIRVFGSDHVFNDMVLEKDTLINTKKLNKILEIDKNNLTVTIEAGIKLYELLDELNKYNMTLPTVTATSYVSVIGATCTGAHGSTYNIGSMANSIINA